MIARRAAALVITVALAATGCSVDPEIELGSPAGTPAGPDVIPTPTPDGTPTPTPDGTTPPSPTPDIAPDPDGDPGASGRLDLPDPGQPAPRTTLSALTGFSRVDCDAFELGELAGPPPWCGLLSVPEAWEDPDPETVVEIPVVVFASTGEPAGDPVVYLEGGPGGHAVGTIGFSYEVLVEPYRATRDVVVYDQRGAGLATPSLQCGEVLDLAIDLLDDDLDPDESAAAAAAAETACRDRLLDDGVDLSAYHSVASSHDLESLRLALGYERWNVLGISYGTRLAQTYVRMYPGGTRSLVLDSIVPVAADPASIFTPNAARAFEALFEACDTLDGCTETHPDLRTRYFSLVDALDEEPVTVEATDNLTGETYQDVVVDGEALLQITFGALYSRVLFAAIPELVAELEEGRTSLLSSFASVEVTNLGFVSIGMLLSVECHEEVAFGDPADIDASLPGDPYYDRFADTANARLFHQTCDRWPAGAAPAIENEAVTSDVPTLLMGGRLDPITPPSAIDEVAAGFTRSHAVVFAWEGHGPGAGACGASIIAAFFDDPTAAPDDECADDETPAFVRRPVGELTLRPVEVSGSGLGSLESLAPEEWEAQGLGVWARSDSLADPSLLAQFAFPFAVDPESTLSLTLQSFGIVGEAVAAEPLETSGGRTWNRWRVDTEGAAWDIAISDDIVIVVAAYPDEISDVLAELAEVYEEAEAT